MSAATVTRSRDRVSRADVAWVGWRQHRLMLVATGAVVLAVAACMALLGVSAASRGSAQISVLMFDTLGEPASLLATCTMAYSGLIAVFWAGPLLSREYEQRTHLLAWSQDVSALRWLAGKTLVLLAAAVALALTLGAAGTVMTHQLNSVTGDGPGAGTNPFGEPFFEAAPLVQVGYTLFAFALGLAISALTRRTVLSMGLTLASLLVVRMSVAIFLRPYYQEPLRTTHPLGGQGHLAIPDDALRVDSGLLDMTGNPMDYPRACSGGYSGAEGYYDCLRHNGATSRYFDYQPIERLDTFHLIEFGIFSILAAALFLLTWRITRSTTRL